MMMEEKRTLRLLPVLFPALLLVMGLAFLLLPKQPFSPLEKRFLAEPPTLTLKGGQFSQDMEAFLGDHFPLRANWVGLDAWRRLLSGSMVADEVWRLSDGALAEAPLPPRWERLNKNLGLLSGFAEKAGKPLFLLTPPAAGAISRAPGYFPYPDQAVLAGIRPAGIRMIPLFEAFRASDTPLYYRTDPHWNAQGLYLAYQEAARHLGFTPLPESAFKVTSSPGFLGSSYARSGLWATPPDILQMWDSGHRLALRFDQQEKTHDSLFFTERLKEPDQYPVFLDGNHGLTDIKNLDNEKGPRLLVLKDSFGNSLVPLLLPHYSRVTVIDLRAFRGSALSLLKEGEYDQVLAVYALKSLATDSNFAWLGQ